MTFTLNRLIAREDEIDGRPYLVAPVVLARQMVMAYPDVVSNEFPKGYSAFKPIDEIGHPDLIYSWQGMPITNYHPKANGKDTSARTPAMSAKYQLGRVYNVQVVGETVVGEGWFDVNKTMQADPMIVANLRAGSPIGISTAYASGQFDNTPGVYKGQRFDGVWRNLRADHLAAFASNVGRCRLEDGCGVFGGGR